MRDKTRDARWPRRIAWAGLVLSIGSVLTALLAAVGTGSGAWAYGTGLGLLRYALFAATAGAVIAMVAFVAGRRSGARTGWMSAVSLGISLAFIAYLGNQIATARSVPAIHDVSTDLEDLPRFTALRLRPDNLAQVPDQGRPELAAVTPEERWKALHREAYGDLRPLRLPVAPERVVARVAGIARDRGWTIARVDNAAGIVEATDTSLFFRFKDDVVVRVRPDPVRPSGSVVDVRSVSRVGVSDIGVNARRVRAFLADLRAAAG
jgi:uncharacterized protein (DUF1499 family)